MIKPFLTLLDCPKVLGHTHTLSDCSSTKVENFFKVSYNIFNYTRKFYGVIVLLIAFV